MLNLFRNYLFISYSIVLLVSVCNSSIYRTVLLKKGLTEDNLSFQLLILKLKNEISSYKKENIKITDYDYQTMEINKNKNIYSFKKYEPIIVDNNQWDFKTGNEIEIKNNINSNHGLGFFHNIHIKNSIFDFRKNINIFSEPPQYIEKQNRYSYKEPPMDNFHNFINNENLYYMPLFCYATYEMEKNGYFNGFDLHLKDSGIYLENTVIQIFDFYLSDKKFPFSNIDTNITAEIKNGDLFFNIIFKPQENLRGIGMFLKMTNHIDISKFNSLRKTKIFWNKEIKIGKTYGGNHFAKFENSSSSTISYKLNEKFRFYCQIFINNIPVISKNYEISIEENRNFFYPCANYYAFQRILFCNIKNDPELELKSFKKMQKKYITLNINFTCN